MAKKVGEPIYYQQFITQVTPARVVWIKYVAETIFEHPWNSQSGLAVFGKFYWADSISGGVSGEWEELTDQPFGFHEASYGVVP